MTDIYFRAAFFVGTGFCLAVWIVLGYFVLHH